MAPVDSISLQFDVYERISQLRDEWESMDLAIRSRCESVEIPPAEFYPLKCPITSELLSLDVWRALQHVLPEKYLSYSLNRCYASHEDGYGLLPLLQY